MRRFFFLFVQNFHYSLLKRTVKKTETIETHTPPLNPRP